MARVVLSVLGVGILFLSACGEGTGPALLPAYDGPLRAGQENPTGYQPGSVDLNDLIGGVGGGTGAETILFTDNFDAGASTLWGNEIGGWAAAGGVYRPLSPSNIAHSSLPFSLVDFSIEFDISNIQAGCLWLRSAAGPPSVGRNGILLTAATAGSGPSLGKMGLYWHIVTGSTTGQSPSFAEGLFTQGSNLHIRVEVSGDTYSAFVNGSTVPATTLTTSAFASGQVAFEGKNSNQTFDNVVVATRGSGP